MPLGAPPGSPRAGGAAAGGAVCRSRAPGLPGVPEEAAWMDSPSTRDAAPAAESDVVSVADA